MDPGRGARCAAAEWAGGRQTGRTSLPVDPVPRAATAWHSGGRLRRSGPVRGGGPNRRKGKSAGSCHWQIRAGGEKRRIARGLSSAHSLPRAEVKHRQQPLIFANGLISVYQRRLAFPVLYPILVHLWL